MNQEYEITPKELNDTESVAAERVLERAREIAVMNNHPSEDVSGEDVDQAIRELSGGPEQSNHERLLESIPSVQHWGVAPASPGHQASTLIGEEEDAEGHSYIEKLFEHGMEEADHAQRLEATKHPQRF
ncbi:MAG: hypothetical protein V4507_04735 [Verrucomicrobiota bacterium]